MSWSLPNIASVAGLLVGVAGLVFSILAWRRASSAEAAAVEAKESVRKGSAAEDLDGLAQKAKELLSSVQHAHAEAAAMCCRDLTLAINSTKTRWEAYLSSPEALKRLEDTAKRVGNVSMRLGSPDRQLTTDDTRRLLKFCQEVLTILSEEAGSARKRAEER